MYIPQLAFGVLMTSSNYDDKEERVTGGRNGFGAKLTNIYSKLFRVIVSENGKTYTQEWTDNMLHHTEPVIKSNGDKKKNEITIEFVPDYQKFQLTDLDADHIALLTRRAWDIAGCQAESLNVYVNNKLIEIHNFKDYVQQIFMAASPNVVKEHNALQAVMDQASGNAEETTATEVTTTTRRKKQKHWTDEFIAYYEPNEYWSVALFGSELKEY